MPEPGHKEVTKQGSSFCLIANNGLSGAANVLSYSDTRIEMLSAPKVETVMCPDTVFSLTYKRAYKRCVNIMFGFKLY